jgi:hypothetical protein
MIVIEHPDILYLLSDNYRSLCRLANPGHENDEFQAFDLMALSAIYDHFLKSVGNYIYIPRLYEAIYERKWKKTKALDKEDFIAKLADSIWKWGTVKGHITENGQVYPVNGSPDDSILYCYDFERHWKTLHIHVAYSNIVRLVLGHKYYVEISGNYTGKSHYILSLRKS